MNYKKGFVVGNKAGSYWSEGYGWAPLTEATIYPRDEPGAALPWSGRKFQLGSIRELQMARALLTYREEGAEYHASDTERELVRQALSDYSRFFV